MKKQLNFLATDHKKLQLTVCGVVFSVFLLLFTSCSSSSPNVTPTSTSIATVVPSPSTETPGASTPADQVQPTEISTATVESTITPEPSATEPPATEPPVVETPRASSTVERFRPVESTAPLLFPDVTPMPVATFLSQAEENGIVSADAGKAFSNDSVSAGGCLSAQHWRRQLDVGGQMSVFLYADAAEAERAAAKVPVYADCDGRSDWARNVYYFQHEALIIFLTTEDSRVYEVVENIASPHFACMQGFNLGPSVCELPAG